MNKGDIVLIPFPFTDLSGNKNRPAVVLFDSGADVTVSFITAQLRWQSEFDISVNPSDNNGLKKISLIKINKLATIDKELIIGKLGTLEDNYVNLLNGRLIQMLKLEK